MTIKLVNIFSSSILGACLYLLFHLLMMKVYDLFIFGGASFLTLIMTVILLVNPRERRVIMYKFIAFSALFSHAYSIAQWSEPRVGYLYLDAMEVVETNNSRANLAGVSSEECNSENIENLSLSNDTTDPFTGYELKTFWSEGRCVSYSVGPDKLDQQGKRSVEYQQLVYHPDSTLWSMLLLPKYLSGTAYYKEKWSGDIVSKRDARAGTFTRHDH
ncbi:hypothetical protein EZV61_15140 [Corallincola luteus]|uniref:Uncharacterized protein n=1 Tax=Corallincola luteus TaxID=1775177 RepID=A0ABY2AI01_9GAMM|nr:hypothetical protein [Corallincola luteus]TCI02263.1 hypothetical protein EZV61_15140 [Corallincola luteus]